MLPVITWHGSPSQWKELEQATQHNCTCEVDDACGLQTECSMHHGLRCDQRLLDGLLFARKIAKRLWAEELSR